MGPNNVNHITNLVCEENDEQSSSAQPFAYAIEMKKQYWASDVDEVAQFCPQTLVLKDYL